MQRIAFVLSITLAATGLAQAKKPPGDILCDDDLQICNENCSMEFGTKASQRERVAQCLYRCDQQHTVCLQRQIAKRAAIPRAAETPEKKKPGSEGTKEEYYSGAPTRFSQEEAPKAAPPEEAEEVAPVRRQVTRSTDLDAAPENDPVAYPDREGMVTKPRIPEKAPEKTLDGEQEDDAAPAEKEPAKKKTRKRPVNELGY